MYVNYCHQCGRALSSAQTERCRRCGWLQCQCGACGCTYEAAGGRSVLATVPAVPGSAVPRRVTAAHVQAPRPASSARGFVAAAAALLLVAGVAAAAFLFVPEEAVAPELTNAAVSDEPAAPAPAGSVATGPLEQLVEAPPAAAPAEATPPAAAAGVQPTAAVATTVVSSPQPTAVPAATVSPPTAATGPLPSVLYIANTEGQGAYLRSQPRDGTDTRIVAWREGTAVTPLETTTVAEAGGPAVWIRVRDPNGQAGWVRQRYLSPSR